MKMNFSIRIDAGIGNAIEDIQMYRAPKWKHSSVVQIFYCKYFSMCGSELGIQYPSLPLKEL